MKGGSAVAVVTALLLLLCGCSVAVTERASSPGPAVSTLETPAPVAVPGIGTRDASLPVVVSIAQPVRVEVPSVGIDIEVAPVGVEPDGQMELPRDIRTAGWYRYGPAPAGDAGSSVISAHVDSFEQGIGPFAALRDIAVGAPIIVTSDDGSQQQYVVDAVRSVAKEQLPIEDVFSRTGERRLTLITCGGQFDENVLNYSDNVIVDALAVS